HVRKAPPVNLVGLADNTNMLGENQKELDVLSNEMFVNELRALEKIVGIVVVYKELRGKY
ncbi:hypothetical protein GGH16_005514, partial [Coemansia sp. RSA 560]